MTVFPIYSEWIDISKRRFNYLDLLKQVQKQSNNKRGDLPLMRLKKYNAPLSIRYKKKLPMLRLKKSAHPHVLKDAVADEENIKYNAELSSPFGAMLSRSTRIWNNNDNELPYSSTLEDNKTSDDEPEIDENVQQQKVYKYQHPFLLSWYERLGASSGKKSNEIPKEIEKTETDLLEDEEGLPLYFRRGKKMLPLQRIGKREVDEENELYPLRFRRRFTHPMASYLQKKDGGENDDAGEISLSDLKKIAGSNWWFRNGGKK